MEPIRIAAAQFENRNGDKEFNLSRIDALTRRAVEQGAQVVSFHEGCIPAYTWTRKLDRQQLESLAEPVPDGPSTRRLIAIAREYDVALLAGLVEKRGKKLHNTYICVNGDGLVARYAKLHPFINSHLSPGNEYVVFDLCGAKCGILICYDNNLVENRYEFYRRTLSRNDLHDHASMPP